MRLIGLKGDTNFALQNQSTVKGQKLWALSVVPPFSLLIFSLPGARLAFLAWVIFTRARVSLALLSRREKEGLLVVYLDDSPLISKPKDSCDWNILEATGGFQNLME